MKESAPAPATVEEPQPPAKEEQPERPWTPSYSVARQGSSPMLKGAELPSEPKAEEENVQEVSVPTPTFHNTASPHKSMSFKPDPKAKEFVPRADGVGTPKTEEKQAPSVAA